MTRRVGPGAPEPLGLTLCEGGANVAVVSSAEAVEICLFDAADRECERLLLPTRFGEVWCGFIEGLREGQRYGLRAHGPFAPARGLRFDARKLLVDPYALALDRPFALDPRQFSHGADAAADSAPVVPKAIAITPQTAPQGPRAARPWRDAIIYELHVKGFTQRLAAVPPADRGTFRGLAHPAAIAHLVELGVTVVELMPCAAWIDERHLPALGLTNYWGYNPIAFMAPDPRLAPGGWADVSAAVEALRAAGIETILDVVLNHSGESDEFGPTVSLRGLDNALYYRLRTGDHARYDNDAGCGNVLALDRAAPLRLAMDALRAWATYGGVDGFRFDLATTLARRAEGFDPQAPFLAALAQDPQLRNLRLIVEPWDVGPGGYRPGEFPAAFGEWNDAFRDVTRRVWRGDRGLVGELATRLAGSADRFAAKSPSRSVNFVTAHDGFTLADLVAHTSKRNAANGEDNRDGADNEISWNNGVEGASDDPAVCAARRRDARALLATLLLSRGAPMLSMGDELGRTQSGNNNVYAQDNETSWIDWAKADAALVTFTRRIVALRKAHPALTRDAFLDGAPLDESLVPDVQWLRPDGAAMRDEDWPQAQALIACLYAPAGDGRAADRVAVAINPSRDELVLHPPAPRPGFVWTQALDSAAPEAQERPLDGARVVAARSVALLVERSDARPAPRGVDAALLDRLAQAAGIGPTWSAIDGSRHIVSDATKRALLTGLRLPCDSAAEARESLGHLADLLDRRATPLVMAARPGAPLALRLPIGRSRPRAILVQRDDGETITVALGEPRPVRWRARDGRLVESLEIEAPALPEGRARLTRDDAPDVAAALIVADRAHIPDRLRRERAAGLAAQLYALPGAGGVGDFAALADLGAHAGRAGLATIGLNPMHALFPEQPERASPYHPSDRRFLDWLYVDCDATLGDSDRRLIDYGATRGAKAQALDVACRAFAQRRLDAPQAPDIRDFADFVAEGGDALFRFACFETLTSLRPERDWRDWPTPLRRGDSEALAALARERATAIEAACFRQWRADRGLAAAAGHARDAGLWLGFYRDLAVGAAPDGAEAWATQDSLIAGVSIGAPPDPFSAAGQIWALPPPDPLALRRDGLAGFERLLESNMRHAGALRIDHVMGLARLFVVPEGAAASEGAYLAYPFEEALAAVALASRRARCLVVGEDLGTVPEGFRERLAAAEVLSYRVLWFEREAGGFTPPSAYPEKAVACASTHDLPTLAGWWAARDIDERLTLGLLTPEVAARERAARAADRRAFLAALRAAGALDVDVSPDAAFDMRLVDAASRFVATTPALIAMTQIDDLAGEETAVNLPGTDRERPNWRRRLSVPLAEALAPDRLAALARRPVGG